MSRLMTTLVLTMVCGGLAALPATAQTPSELQAQITALQAQITAQQGQIATLQSQITGVEADIPDCMTTAAGAGTINDVIFSGCNVHVQNGQGQTNSRNRVGNLIIGYNERVGTPARGGSHNVVIGQRHSYSSHGGLVAGYNNTLSAKYASVIGGRNNEASGFGASVSGGRNNEASGDYASVSGGRDNTANGFICQRQRRQI